MKRIYLDNALYEIKTQMESLLKKAKDMNIDKTKGYLSISTSKNFTRYYHYYYENNKLVKKYIRKKDRKLAKVLAQKTYNDKVIKELENNLRFINTIIKKYDADILDKIYKSNSIQKQDLIKPIIETKDQFIDRWVYEEFESNPYNFYGSIIKSKKGERVRSKSEKILADILYDKGIPYRYEARLSLSNYCTKYPDFTILNPNTLEIIYLEHFGAMDVADYAKEAISKIQLYAESGIFLGFNFFATFETKDEITNYETFSKLIDKIINK